MIIATARWRRCESSRGRYLHEGISINPSFGEFEEEFRRQDEAKRARLAGIDTPRHRLSRMWPSWRA